MIIGVAFKTEDGTIISMMKPKRHHHIIRYMAGHPSYDRGDIARSIQGFITEKGVFLNRVEAAEYALEIKQITKMISSKWLFSEDLW